MPLYQYLCDACGHRFEQIQKFSDPRIEVCPQCGARQVQKLLSSPAIQFKGSGWYITDYARKGAGSEAATADGKDAKPDGKDAKPAGADAKGAGTDAKSAATESKSSSSDSSSSAASSGSTSTAPPTSSSKK